MDHGHIDEFGFYVDEYAVCLGLGLPARHGELHGFLHNFPEIDGTVVILAALIRAVEATQPPDDFGGVGGAFADDAKCLQSGVGMGDEVLLFGEHVAVAGNDCEHVIKIMRDAPGHLPQGAQAFLLDHLMLRFLQVGEGLLELLCFIANLILQALLLRLVIQVEHSKQK